MRLILNSTKATTILILVYTAITCLLTALAFSAGKDLGYIKELSAGTTAEYVNGVQDGVSLCIDAVMNNNRERTYIFREREKREETL